MPARFLANICGPNACGIAAFATGVKGRPGFEGTWRDAEDGQLSGNPIAQGSVDSTIEIALDRDDVLLQKAHQVVGDGLVDLTESGIGSFRNSEDPVKVFQTGLGGFS